MIAIKPVSDLRNYNEVLQDVADESPVFLTKNGRGSYAVITIKDYDPYTVTFKEALPLYQAKIDSIIADWDEIMIINGAYGPYVKGPGRRNFVRIPKDVDPKKVTKEQAEEYLANKPKKTRRPAKRRATAKKATAKKK